jgi:hypothetical protein
MNPPSFVILHGGYGVEIALLEYLYRVLLHLLAFGGVAVLVFWGLSVVEAIRSTFVAER